VKSLWRATASPLGLARPSLAGWLRTAGSKVFRYLISRLSSTFGPNVSFLFLGSSLLRIPLLCFVTYALFLFYHAGVDTAVIESRTDEIVGPVSTNEHKAFVGHLGGV